MNTFDLGVRWILKAEGAESADPADPGGLTRYGISQRAHPDVNVSALTEGEAIAIYWLRYWQACGLDPLPAPIAVAVLDAAVQHGPRPAARMLQHGLGVETDGVIGEHTVEAARAADVQALLVGYCARRGVYYANLGSFGRFGYGWLRRLFGLYEVCRALTP